MSWNKDALRVLVCGGRDRMVETPIYEALDALAERWGWFTIIEGGARGADEIARKWARSHYCGLVTVEALWKTQGRSAGIIRNARMLTQGKPDVGLAFPSLQRGLEGTGTGDMVNRMKDVGLPVKVFGGTLLSTKQFNWREDIL